MHSSKKIRYKLLPSNNIQLPSMFNCLDVLYESDHSILQEEISVLKTISLDIYRDEII